MLLREYLPARRGGRRGLREATGIEFMADKAAEQVAACDAAASSQPQQFLFDLPEGPLLTLHRGEQVGNSAWVEP